MIRVPGSIFGPGCSYRTARYTVLISKDMHLRTLNGGVGRGGVVCG